MSGSAAVTETARVSPYKGLAPYGADDSSFFFGRERERDVVVANLRARHLTVLYGESGVGKSSLLHAGVLSYLRQEAQEELEDQSTPEFIPVAFSAWRDDPVTGVLEAVASSVAKLIPGRVLRSKSARDLAGTLDAWARELGCEFLIILDQFEEYFLYHAADEDDGSFDIEFPRALNDSKLHASFLVAIREDAFAKLDRFKVSVPGLLDNYLRVRHLDERCAREAIEGPMEAWNESAPPTEQIQIEKQLVEAVLREVKTGLRQAEQAGQGVVEQDGRATEDERVEAPYLQLVLTRLWDEEMSQGSRVLRLQTLEHLGGAERIVQNHLDEALGALPPEEQELAAAAFYYLVTPEGTKIAQSVETLAAYSGHPAPMLERVLEKLAVGSARIVRPIAPAPGARGGTRYEIFHDVLASAILDWRARVERVRLEAEREEAEERRAEAQRQEAIQRTRAQRFRALAVGLGVLLVGGLVAWGIGQQRSADRERAVRNSRELAQSAVIRIPSDPELSLLLSREAFRVRRTPQAEEAFRESLMASHVLTAYRGHRDSVNTAGFSRDGSYVVTASDDGTARIWRTATGEPVRKLTGHTDWVSSASFSPDGRLVATASLDGTLRLWSVSSGRQVRRLGPGTTEFQSVAFDPSGQLIVSAGTDGVRIWETTTGRTRQTMRGHTALVTSAEFSPNGKLVVSSSDDSTARIWSAASGRQVRALRGHTDKVNSASFSRGGRKIVTASADRTARVWDVSTGRTLTMLRGGDVFQDAEFSPDGKRMVTCSLNQIARIWDLATGHTIFVLRGHGGSVQSAAFGPSGDTVLTASFDHTARLWNVPPATPRLRHPGPVYSASFSGGGRAIISASEDGSARVWSATQRKARLVLPPLNGPLYDVALGPDAKTLITAGSRGARLWDLTGKPVAKHFGNLPGAAISVDFSPDGRTAVLAGKDDRRVRVFDVDTGRQRIALPAGGDADQDVRSAAYSNDGEQIATANKDGVARVFDAHTGKRTAVLRERTQLSGQIPLFDAEFSPDGKLLLTAGEFGTVKLWNLQRKVAVAILPGLSGDIYSASFSPDGKLIVTASSDGRVDLWDRATTRRIGLLERYNGPVWQAAFNSDGKQIVTAGNDGTVRIIRCDVCAPIDDLLRLVPGRVTRDLSPEERRLYVD